MAIWAVALAMTEANRLANRSAAGVSRLASPRPWRAGCRHLEPRTTGMPRKAKARHAGSERRRAGRWLEHDRRSHSWCVQLLGWRADRLPAHKGLKDEHRCAAVQTDEARLGGLDLGVAVLSL